MARNNSNNSVKHKINGYDVTFSKTRTKWQVKKGNKLLKEGTFKECKQYCKTHWTI